MSKTMLITGGAGFIGSNFTRLILNKYPDYKVINLDKLTYSGNLKNLRDVENSRNYSFIKGDVCDEKIVNILMKDVDIVVHFAAETHVDRSIADASYFIKTDVLGTFNLLDSARKNNVKKFIQISTDEVYGSTEKGSFSEEDELKPSNPYSASKAGADRLAYSYFVTHKLPVIITRSSNNFGSYQHPEKLIPLFITNALEDKKLPLYGDGLNMRDWIYVMDNCEAIDFVMNSGKDGEVYNIGAGNERTNLEITKAILKELGKNESLIEFVKDRQGHDRRYSLNCSKINNLGWSPRFSFNDAIKQTVKWYKENKSWWHRIKSGEFMKYYEDHYMKKHGMRPD